MFNQISLPPTQTRTLCFAEISRTRHRVHRGCRKFSGPFALLANVLCSLMLQLVKLTLSSTFYTLSHYSNVNTNLKTKVFLKQNFLLIAAESFLHLDMIHLCCNKLIQQDLFKSQLAGNHFKNQTLMSNALNIIPVVKHDGGSSMLCGFFSSGLGL